MTVLIKMPIQILAIYHPECIIWSAILCIYLTSKYVSIRLGNNYDAVGLVFLLGPPLQVLDVLWVFFRSLFQKQKPRVVKTATDEKEQVEAQVNAE